MLHTFGATVDLVEKHQELIIEKMCREKPRKRIYLVKLLFSHVFVPVLLSFKAQPTKKTVAETPFQVARVLKEAIEEGKSKADLEAVE